MRYGRIAGVNRDVSRLVMGCDNQATSAHAAAMFDDFFECGGNAFDTAHLYGRGLQERLFGEWIGARGVREEIVLIAKGAHTPDNHPAMVGPQLEQSLERMGVERVEVYFLHRDNPDVPVGEFVDALNEQRAAGRIGVCGASNWSIDRIQAANDCAGRQGGAGFGAISNNFSLARMVNPIWDGCVAASDPASRAWFTRTQTPLFPWSSQARGFFVPGVADPDDRSNEELVFAWYSDDNFRRQDRVNEMAARRGVHPINIALAYVLCQAFPTFALIGPRSVHETHVSLPALDIDLSPEETRWLNLEDGEAREAREDDQPGRG